MTYKPNMLTPGRAALVAALAFASTPAFAQQAVPETSQPVTVTPQATPAPAPSNDTSTPAVDPLAAMTVTKATSAKSRAAKATATRTAAKAQVATRSAPVAAKTAAPAAVVSAAPSAMPPAPAVPLTPPVEATPAPSPAPVAQAPASTTDETPLIAGAAGAALLMLGGTAFAVSRRRRTREEDERAMAERAYIDERYSAPATVVEEPIAEPDPVRAEEPMVLREKAEPVVAERSAFNWAKPAETVAAPVSAAEAGSRIEQAYAGPTPDNPFLSLKKRLKRATFYDQRDRMVAAGEAKPVEPTAGLPERMVEKAKAMAKPKMRAARSAPAMTYGFSYAPA